MKKFTLKDAKQFCDKALVFPEADYNNKEEWDAWLEAHKIHITVGGCDLELEYNADIVTELEAFIEEVHTIFYEEA